MMQGKIEALSEYVSDTIEQAGFHVLMNFSEKNIQLIYFTLLNSISEFWVKTEYECKGGYIDLFFEGNPKYTPYNIIVELKYIKASEKKKQTLIEEKTREGLEQLAKYDIDKPNTRKYLVIFVGNKVSKIIEADC